MWIDFNGDLSLLFCFIFYLFYLDSTIILEKIKLIFIYNINLIYRCCLEFMELFFLFSSEFTSYPNVAINWIKYPFKIDSRKRDKERSKDEKWQQWWKKWIYIILWWLFEHQNEKKKSTNREKNLSTFSLFITLLINYNAICLRSFGEYYDLFSFLFLFYNNMQCNADSYIYMTRYLCLHGVCVFVYGSVHFLSFLLSFLLLSV